jgi:hypothetical protein
MILPQKIAGQERMAGQQANERMMILLALLMYNTCL